jgi:hypothetical protein
MPLPLPKLQSRSRCKNVLTIAKSLHKEHHSSSLYKLHDNIFLYDKVSFMFEKKN